MNGLLLHTAGNTASLTHARQALISRGFDFSPQPGPDVTHLLLPVPSFDADGSLKGGSSLQEILARLPKDITVIGGNVQHPALAGYRVWDLLKDPVYVAANAALTADCAIRIAGKHLLTAFQECPVLVIGWGRIGKCLAAQLRALGTRVTVSTRKPEDLAILSALGYGSVPTGVMHSTLSRFRVVFNTAPVPVISREQAVLFSPDCIVIDLASVKGIAGDRVLWERGLPNRLLPEASGLLIAKSIIRLIAGKEIVS